MIVLPVCFAGVLDGREVKDAERAFLKNWQAMRDGRLKAAPSDGLEDSGDREVPSAKNILQMLRQSRAPPTMPALPQRAPLKGHWSKGASRSGSFVHSSHSEPVVRHGKEASPGGGAGASSRLPPLAEEPPSGGGVTRRWVLFVHTM